jgi:hypothetical protein
MILVARILCLMPRNATDRDLPKLGKLRLSLTGGV